jgi:hypothetical protein
MANDEIRRAAAKELARRELERRRSGGQAAADYVQPEPPPGMVMDPNTGQMIDTAQREAVTRATEQRTPGVSGALMRTGRVADDFVRGAADMATFGTADEISAALSGGDYDANLAGERARDSAGGAARFTGQVAGALAIPGGAAKTVKGAVGQGAALGAGYGFGSGEGGLENRLESAAYGGAAGGLAGGAIKLGTNALARRAASKAIPTREALKEASAAAYQAADDAGIVFRPRAIQNLSMKVKSELADFGYTPKLQPRIQATLEEIDRLSSENVTLKGVETLRRIAKAAGSSTDASERALSQRIVSQIDDLMVGAQPGDVVMGDLKAGTAALKEARSLWSMKAKSDVIAEMMEKAQNSAPNFSGSGMENAMRTQFRQLANNPKRLRVFTPAEQEAIKKVARGGPIENALRMVGKFAPTGIVSTALSGGAGAAIGGPAGAVALPTIGMAAREGATAMTGRNIANVDQMIRSGGRNATQIALEAAQGRGDQRTVEFIQRLLAGDQSLRGAAAPLAASVAVGR